MLYYSLIFLMLAIFAGGFGFWGVAGTATLIAKILFVLFLVGFLVSVIGTISRQGSSI